MSIVKIDFTDSATPPSGWNSIDSPTTTGVRIADLLDDAGGSTGITLTQELAIDTANTAQGVTGTHHGWPEEVWNEVWTTASTAELHVFTLSGLTSGDKLSVLFAGHNTLDRDTLFTLKDSTGTEVWLGTFNYNCSPNSTPAAPIEALALVPADGIVEIWLQENTSIRPYLIALELAINEGSSAALRATQVPIEVLSVDENPTLRATQVPLEVLSVDENPTLRATQVVLEVLSTVETLTIEGTAVQVLPMILQAAVATLTIEGEAAQILPPIEQDAEATQPSEGGADQVLPPIEQDGEATMLPEGNGDQVLPPIEQDGVAESDRLRVRSGVIRLALNQEQELNRATRAPTLADVGRRRELLRAQAYGQLDGPAEAQTSTSGRPTVLARALALARERGKANLPISLARALTLAREGSKAKPPAASGIEPLPEDFDDL